MHIEHSAVGRLCEIDEKQYNTGPLNRFEYHFLEISLGDTGKVHIVCSCLRALLFRLFWINHYLLSD